MSRVYINGVHDFSYDGKNLSFSLTDTHQVKTGDVRKTVSFHCVSEIHVIEDICKYIIKEIDNIKSMSKNNEDEIKVDKKEFAKTKKDDLLKSFGSYKSKNLQP